LPVNRKSNRQAIANSSNVRMTFSKTKFNGAGGPRMHIGFMRIRDLYARCAFAGDGDFDATRKQNSTG
jgi:hypothetical protein